MIRTLTDSFREDAPRPPVPGEEGESSCQPPRKLAMKTQKAKTTVAPLSSDATPRRNEGELGEPEGSASPDSPLSRWTKSLHSLLGDQDGAHLFRTFLEREKCVDTLDFWFACNGFRQMDLKETKTLRVAKAIYKRSYRRKDPVNPYHVNSGHVFAPATSANDSEVSSDALTDDSMSMTDSSVDGIPPYRLGKKHLQREMQRSVKMNGQVSLPHFPRTHRLPKEMTPVDPASFAAELIARLEKLKREQETMSSLEERLQQIKEEEEKEDTEVPAGSGQAALEAAHPQPHSLALLPSSGSCEEDPQAILDEHLSRVLKTPGCQSPGVGRHSPRSKSPDHHHPLYRGSVPSLPYPLGSKPFVTKQSTKHVHHHYIHHHSGLKSKEQIEVEAAQRVQCLCPGSTDYCPYPKCRSHSKDQSAGQGDQYGFGSRSSTLSKRSCKASESSALPNGDGGMGSGQLPSDGTDRSHSVWQWMLEGERQSKHKTHSTQGTKKVYSSDSRGAPGERSGRQHLWGSGGHQRTHQPAHPFIQDPAMPPLPPPNTLAQLEEACRRLEEVSKPAKQRCSASSLQRDRSHPSTLQSGVPPLSSPGLQTEEHKEPKRAHSGPSGQASEMVVTYFFCGEEIPYRRMMKSHCLTLGHFKEQLRKKGNYRLILLVFSTQA
ncbi:UNVERIFIED_CONTAM: hypothetical protein FKN15_043077 [Acipenser sinensis]